MGAFKDLTGQKFSRLTVIARGPNKGDEARWHCKCDCGKEVLVMRCSLARGATQSCGCMMKERSRIFAASQFTTHGLSRTNEYRIYAGMKTRCYNKASRTYQNYGGRGIIVCQRWLDSFEQFLADMGRRPSRQHSIERRDNEGPYSPMNCVWATIRQQANNKRNVRLYSHNGRSQSLARWAREIGMQHQTLRHRVNAGWDIASAITTPIDVSYHSTGQGTS
jgi:hypothetical protein